MALMVDPKPIEEIIPRLNRVHGPTQCAGEHCVIHNPSDHHMRDWLAQYQNWDRMFVRFCPAHDKAHPDPDAAAALDAIEGRTWGDSYFRHKCDCDCCDQRVYEENRSPLEKLMLALERGEITQQFYDEAIGDLL